MLSFRTSRLRVRTSSRVVRSRHVSREALGCVVVRRITDDAGRGWRVREFRSQGGVGLFFSCDVPGIRAETRASSAVLESLCEEDLVSLLQHGGE